MVTAIRKSQKWGAGSFLLGLGGIGGCQELPRTYDSGPTSESVMFSDNFDENSFDRNWKTTGTGYKIVDGRLTVHNAHNHPLWLKQPLPDHFRIDFDAWALEDSGDIKFEVAGDGKSFATKSRYIASGYVLIFGGWNNTLHLIARQDEHGPNKVSRKNPRVVPHRQYRMTVIRNGSKIRWLVDNQELLRFYDEKPLLGPSNRSFAFNGWESSTQFDNLVIRALPSPP